MLFLDRLDGLVGGKRHRAHRMPLKNTIGLAQGISKVLVRGLDMWYQFDIVCYAYDVRVISFLATLLGADTHRAEPAQYKFWILH